MHCPRCNQGEVDGGVACTHCGFTGPPDQVEELAHVIYLLDELETWRGIRKSDRSWLRARYLRRRQELEIALGLRAPPLTASEARKLQWELFCLGELQQEVGFWLEEGWVHTEQADRLRQGAGKRSQVLTQRLKGAPPAPSFHDIPSRLKLIDYLEQILNLAHARDHFVDDEAYAAALADLEADRRELEIEAGLRPRPPEREAEPEAALEPVPGPAVVPPPRPREPITWDRVWQTLLSERTLNVLLFLGAFLLMASASTYVVYNWEKLSPVVQLSFIVLFTLSFYGAGWFLRVRMGLRASGIAVTAVGSLLVPLDFYAIFVAGGVWPPGAWPWVWLMASAVCLPIYTFTAVRIRAEFFGYLVAVALGSLVCASLQVAGVSNEWWLVTLVGLALVIAVLTYRLQGSRSSWSILSRPLRLSSLLATAVILPLSIGWWVVGSASGAAFDASLAGAWMLGSILFVYTAVCEGNPWLGRAAATTLPVALYLLLRLAFEPLEVETPWYALGWATLAPIYLVAGHRWLASVSEAAPGQGDENGGSATLDPVLRAHGRTATGWGLALMALAAVWSVFDLWAAASTCAVLAAGSALAIRLWERPRALPVFSIFSFASVTFAMAAAHLEPPELCLGWALLALLHIIAALRLRAAPDYAARLFAATLAMSALAMLPPPIFSHEPLLTYILGNWIGLCAWLVWLDHTGRHPGLAALLERFGPLRPSILQWAIALPSPFFAAMLYTRFRPPDAWLGLLLGVLAWACFLLAQAPRLSRMSPAPEPWPTLARHWSFPWYIVSYAGSLAGPLLALHFDHQLLLGVTILLAAALYFASAWALRERWWLIPGGLALPLGLFVLLDHWQVPWPRQSVVLALVVAAYLLGGVWLERRRDVPGEFMAVLYAVAQAVALVALIWGLAPAVDHLLRDLPWPDSARLWAAAGQLVLGVAYGLFAWFQAQEMWAHVAAWLGVMAGGLVATAYSQGRGSSAFKAALLAVVYVLAERALTSEALRRRWPPAERAWPLYRRALLIAGWAVSAGAVALALFRNLGLLGGGPVREWWAIAGLLTITALYAGSAWLFRRRILVWLAGVLIIVPWTLLTSWGWFLWRAPPSMPRYALSWTVLACLELVLGLYLCSPLLVKGREGERQLEGYGFPLRMVANLLLPFSLFWAVADPATSSITWGLGLAFYVVSALADHRRALAGWRRARFLYPAVAVMPVWAIYVLNHLVPTAPYEWYGLLLLALALPLLAVGWRLRKVDPADALPLYLGAYGVALVGTMLVAHQRPLFAGALTFDALLCILSAWIFREPLWGYPAAALAPAAMLVALAGSQVPPERRGWWLIGLGAVYVALTWLLRRLERHEYATPPLVMAFIVMALGLPPSSLDEVGAFWGYLVAALIYAVVAAWLRQPLLLAASAALVAVSYAAALIWLRIDPALYGLALFPGILAALVLAHLLDWRLGRPGPVVPSRDPRSWRLEALLDWWAAAWYVWAYLGALVAVGLSWTDPSRLAATLMLAAVVYLHATWRFRSRVCLLLAGALVQGAALAIVDAAGWLAYPAWAALAFLPVTLLTVVLALAIETLLQEGPPLGAAGLRGWSRPFYLLLAVDLVVGQAAALTHSEPGAIVTIVQALLLALLATVWTQPALPFVAVALGIVGGFQTMTWLGVEPGSFAVGLALLALGYGLLGYEIELARPEERQAQIWRRPLEWSALGLSMVALLWMMAASLNVVDLLIRTLLGVEVGFADYASQVRVVMWVLAITGLLYLATAAMRRWWVVGYVAVAFLLVAWALWWRFFLDMASFQWYAVPAGLYLFGVGWMEWRRGHKALVRWIDGVGMLIWLGTAWWQSLPGVMEDGWPYALLMGAESLLLVWWGSARRLKRFLYAGVVGVVVNAVTQSIEPLLSANRWIVFGIVGLLLVALAVLVERRLQAIRELSAELRQRLEGWE